MPTILKKGISKVKKNTKKISCMAKEMHLLSTPKKKKKYPNPKQRVAIALSVCGLSQKKKTKKK